MTSLSVLSDAPAAVEQDRLQFKRYIDPLLEILTNPATETPFTVGVFGAWGSGKSTLIRMLDQRLAEVDPKGFVRVDFDAWVHRSEENMLVPLLHALHDTLETDKARFVRAAKNVGKMVMAIGSEVVLKKLTGGVISLEKIGDVSKTLQEEMSKVESEIRKLRTTLKEAVDEIYEEGARLVLFIDNLARSTAGSLYHIYHYYSRKAVPLHQPKG